MADQSMLPESAANGEAVLHVRAPFRVTQDSPKEESDPLWLRVFSQAVAFLKVVIWPVVIILLLIVYHAPLGEVAEQLPGMVSQAQKISVGGLSMEIQVQAKRTGGADLAEALKQLDPGDIEELIHTGRGSWGVVGSGMSSSEWFLPSATELAKLKRLEAAGLLEVVTDRSTPPDGAREKITFDEFGTRLQASNAKSVDTDSHDSRRFQLPLPWSSDVQRLRSTQYRLTKPGKDAFESILNAITAQLSQGKKVATRDSEHP